MNLGIKPKILIIIPNLDLSGGAEKSASILSNLLADDGYEIYVLTFYYCSQMHKTKGKFYCLYEKGNGEKKFVLKALFHVKKLFLRTIVINGICKENAVNTIFAFMEDASFTSLLTKILFRLKQKVVISIRTNPEAYGKTNRMMMKLYPRANKIVSVSNGVKESLVQKGISRSKIITIYNPIEISKNKLMSNTRIKNFPEDIFLNSFVFLNIGRLDRPKGQWYLIRSFKKVVENYSNAKLIIIGIGPLMKDLTNLIRESGLENSVYILGSIPNVFPYLKNADCFVFTSLWEGFPNVLLEALSMGLPIISSDCHFGPREILAPELNLFDRVEYPYYTTYGVLIRRFQMDFKIGTLNVKSLCEEEEMLIKVLCKFLENPIKNREKNEKRALNFNLTSFFDAWKRLI
ncbi:MAG: glycosyltransferase [Candidatus Lokiarchaeota archaeon]|nr:glycosyltransferase [Candidatus Lokiarchaeota archaeon]